MKVELTKRIKKQANDYEDEISIINNQDQAIIIKRRYIPDLIKALVEVHGYPGPIGVTVKESI